MTSNPTPGGSSEQRRNGAYHPNADLYFQAGWQPFPLRGKDQDIPGGVTGRAGRLLIRSDVATWMVTSPDHNIGLRLDGVIGIDVDNYMKGDVEKRGWVTLKLAEERWGKLPKTWRSTARPQGGSSGILFFRVPPGYLGLVSQLILSDANGERFGDIEICQYHHRYAVVAPSIHPDLHLPYIWYDADGNRVIGLIPKVWELPWLPPPWLEGLTELGAREIPGLDPALVAPQLALQPDWHPFVGQRFNAAVEAMNGAPGSRHDNVGFILGQLTGDERRALSGATSAIDALRPLWGLVLGPEREHEFSSMVEWSRARAASQASLWERDKRLVAQVFGNIRHTIGTIRHEAPEPIGPIPDLAKLPEVPEPVARHQFLPGGSIFDEPEITPAIWGTSTEVLWAEGEPLMIAAPPGVGKTTLAGQLVMGMCGVPGFSHLLELPITPRGRVLYLAADRPRQIMRSLRRQARLEDRALLDEHLVIWKGPPPTDLALEPERLLMMAQEVSADVVVLDSLKDMAVGITDDKVGAGLNRAIQLAIAGEVEVLVLHHQRKGQNGEKPKTLEDVYGSTWLTAGMGSVALLWGAAGDLVVELIHLKQPAETVGPFKIEHDHVEGRSILTEGQWDVLAYLANVGSAGATSKQAAQAWFAQTPNRAQIMRAQRKLERLVVEGLVEVLREPMKGPDGKQLGAIYVLVKKP